MKIMTILGTRPEIIRLSRIIEKLDSHSNHVLVHTGQNYDSSLNQIFFDELGVRTHDHFLGISGGFPDQMGRLFPEVSKVLIKEQPDKVLILGDTNSALSAIMAKKLFIPVYHMEAGNRCFDDRVPEEINRRIVDHSSDILIPYTQNSKHNLINEGIPLSRIYVSGNPILEVINSHRKKIDASTILNTLDIKSKEYFLITLHRSENVDVENRLQQFLQAFEMIFEKYKIPLIISTHPHTKSRMLEMKVLQKNKNIRFMEPFGLFDFIKLESNAMAVLSDSGTVQEECCIFKVPNVTLRDVTERPETIESGSNILSGADPHQIMTALELVLSREPEWSIPVEYLVENVSDTILNIILGYNHRSCHA